LIGPERGVPFTVELRAGGSVRRTQESSSALRQAWLPWTLSIEREFKQSGLTLAMASPVISAPQTAQGMTNAARDTADPRMKAPGSGQHGLCRQKRSRCGQGESR
jgi:hypothetical protein